MTRILVLGAGRQGRVVAAELAKHHQVTVADATIVQVPNTDSVQVDLRNLQALLELLQAHDMAVGALPAALGFDAAKAVIAAQRNYVDLSFYPEDVYTLQESAVQAGVAVLPDCGLAPGISNLVVGRAVANGRRESIVIEVGGVARDPKAPYGYVVSWALSDLLAAYTRPARLRRNHEMIELPVFSELQTTTVAGIGPLESFLTDGCRTLLHLGVPNVVEKTLRWPGHVAAIAPLLAEGRLIEELQAKCSRGADLVVMRIAVDGEEVTLVATPRDGLSAMSRTTALTCAAFAHYLALYGAPRSGIIPPEALGADERAYCFILAELQRAGICLSPALPFMG